MVLPTRAIRDEAVQRQLIAHQTSLWLPRLITSSGKPRKTPDNLHRAKTENTGAINGLIVGGDGGIRTQGTVTRTTVFEF